MISYRAYYAQQMARELADGCCRTHGKNQAQHVMRARDVAWGAS